MTRYEEKINARISSYHWKEMVEMMAYDEEEPSQASLDCVFRDFQAPLDSNCRRALKQYYYYDKTGVHERNDLDTLPTMDMPCAEYEELPHAQGVYFLGMIGTNPDGKNYYLVKVGGSENIHSRVRQYATYNPMIYIGGYCLTGYRDAETNSHRFLRKKAYAVALHTDEWFYVDEETYFELCEIFADKEMFKAIAEGRD